MSDFNWSSVPFLVKLRYKRAAAIQHALDWYDCAAFWEPETGRVLVKFANAEPFRPATIGGIPIEETQWGPDNLHAFVQIKTASALGWLNKPYEWAGALTGGPSPLSNGIVSALLGAGGGYALGHAVKAILPAKYFQNKKAPAVGAAMGALAGAGLAVPEIYAHTSLNQEATGQPHWMQSIFQNTNDQPFAKKADGSGVGAMAMPINMDAFNRVIWNDPAKSPNPSPTTTAMGSGLVSGIQQMYGNSQILTPRHFVSGLMAAGTDVVTANIAGRTLGAMGIITPKAQDTLQQMGAWTGMMRGVTQSVFGAH